MTVSPDSENRRGAAPPCPYERKMTASAGETGEAVLRN